MKRSIVVFLLLVTPVVLPESKFNFIGKLTLIKAFYLPDKVNFQIDASHSVCSSGKWLKWKKVMAVVILFIKPR